MMHLLRAWNWQTPNALTVSLMPSLKYQLQTALFSISWLLSLFEMIFGLGHMAVIAFAVLAMTELISGLYASLAIRRERLESWKMGRFVVKLALLMVVFYVLHQFAQGFRSKQHALAAQTLDWLYMLVFIYSALEYLVSVLENIAVIGGKPNHTLIDAIKKRLNKWLEN